MSGQKLALEIVKDNYNDIKASFFQKWATFSKNSDIQQRQQKLKANMEIIVNLRLKIKEMHLENEDLASENEQLRKTSMDGIFLAQTWKELSEKIKILSVDLADKSHIIRSLMNENYGLASNIDTMKSKADQIINQKYY